MSSNEHGKSETQIERFKRTARELGADESKERFEGNLKRLAQYHPKDDGNKMGAKANSGSKKLGKIAAAKPKAAGQKKSDP
jgi:hypothetical protein